MVNSSPSDALAQTTSQGPQRPDYDSPWKEALEHFLPQAVALFTPELHMLVDWSHPPEFLDKEFQALHHGIRHSRRQADKLVRLRLHSGRVIWLLLHVEVQGGKVTDTSLRRTTLRVQQYDYRIHDRYVLQPAIRDRLGAPPTSVCTLAIFTGRGCGPPFLSTEHQPLHNPQPLRYRAVYLSRWLDDWEALQALSRTNPFAVIVMAQLSVLRHPRAERLQPKIGLVRMLSEHGYSHQSIVHLYRLIDWILTLPPELHAPYTQAIEALKKERHMPFVMTHERIYQQRGIEIGLKLGEQRGQAKALQDLIQLKFGNLPDWAQQRLQQADAPQLQQWTRRILAAESLQDLFTA